MSRTLSFRHVETIHAIVLTGSVTGAALRLHVTQPAISNVLRDAEERLGYQLFDRRGGRLLPTAVADRLFDEIERSFTGLDAINAVSARLERNTRRQFPVACTPAFAATVLPEIAQACAEQGHELFFTVHSRVAHHVAALVASRKADFGFGLAVPPVPGVECAVIAELPLFCYLPAGHALAAQPVVRAHDLAHEPMISLSRIEGVDDLIDAAFGDGLQRPVPVAECPAAIAACAMVANGLGFMLFDLLPAALFSTRQVVVRPFEPTIRLTYQGYWFASRQPEFDPQPLLAMARQSLARYTSLENLDRR